MATDSGFPVFLTDDDYGTPVTRLWFALREASTSEAAGPDGGRASEVVTLGYVSPGRTGQAWRAVGGDPDYLRFDASLTSDTGPWTDITAGSLADATPEGDEGTLYLRAVAKRWATVDNPVLDFEIRLAHKGRSGIEDA